VAAIAAAVLVVGAVAAALTLRSTNQGSNATPSTPGSGPRSTPTGSAAAPPAANAAAYCAQLKSTDRDPRLLNANTANRADVGYAIQKFQALGALAPPSVHDDWARLNRAIRRGLHHQSVSITQSQLQALFDHIKSEAESDCNYSLRGGPFG
jgi:hypothetical protein